MTHTRSGPSLKHPFRAQEHSNFHPRHAIGMRTPECITHISHAYIMQTNPVVVVGLMVDKGKATGGTLLLCT